MLGDAWGFDAALTDAVQSVVPEAGAAARQQQQPFETYADALLRIANSIVKTDAQRKLLDMQVQRAQRGLPPLDTRGYETGRATRLPFELSPIALGVLALGAIYFFARRNRRA